MPFLGKTPSQIVDPEVDIDGGTIDGVAIGSVTANAGAFTNLTATGTLTLPDDGISGDDVNGGTISNFASTGIDDNATSTAITIDSSQRVGIGTASPASLLDVSNSGEVVGTVRSTSTSGARQATLRLNVPSTGGDDPAGKLEFTYGTGYTVAGSILMTHSPNNMRFYTGATERMRIDNSGFVGINTTSPNSLLDLRGTSTNQNVLQLSNSAGVSDGGADNQIRVTCNGDTNWGNLDIQAYHTIFTQNGTERMRIDSSGNFLVGKSQVGFATEGTQILASGELDVTTNNVIPLFVRRNDGTGAGTVVQFYRSSSAAGGINASAGSSPAFFSSSDERLKDNIADHPSELSNIMDLRPVSWDWKDAVRGSGEGFVAQELEQTAWSDLVSEGDDGYKIVAGLGVVETRIIKALQEAVTRIETLEAEVAALKGA